MVAFIILYVALYKSYDLIMSGYIAYYNTADTEKAQALV